MNVIVSIIVPVYNAEKYLDRCITSVVNQTFPDLELILVNDGSRDNSLEICKRYAETDNRIIIIDKLNGGVSSARNAGIERARGTYISFLDSDDYLDLSFLEDFSIISGIDFYAQGSTNEYNDRPTEYNSLQKSGQTDLSSFLERIITTELISTPWAKLYSRAIILNHNLRFNQKHSYAEDRLFNIEYLHLCKSFFISTATGYHYTHDNPQALTKIEYPGELMLDYIKHYRPNLLRLINKVNLSEKVNSAARFSYNYHLIQAVISIVNKNTFSFNNKKEILKTITEEEIIDANTQNELPLYFRIVAKALQFPIGIAIILIKILGIIKK